MNGIFDDIWDSAKGAVSTAAKAIEDIPAEWSKKVNELKAKAAEFSQVFGNLQNQANIAALNPRLKADYDSLMARGVAIKSKIQSITSAIDSGYNTVKNVFNGVGLAGLGELGVLPLIPIAVIVGGVTLISMWLTDAYTMNNKLNAARAAGANADQITKIANSGGGGLTSGITATSGLVGNIGFLLVIGVGIYLFLPQIKKALGAK